MKRVIFLSAFVFSLFATNLAFADHHEEAVADSSAQCEYAKKECHLDSDKAECAKWSEGKRSKKMSRHHAKGRRGHAKKGCHPHGGKLMHLLLSAILFGGIGYLIGRKRTN